MKTAGQGTFPQKTGTRKERLCLGMCQALPRPWIGLGCLWVIALHVLSAMCKFTNRYHLELHLTIRNYRYKYQNFTNNNSFVMWGRTFYLLHSDCLKELRDNCVSVLTNGNRITETSCKPSLSYDLNGNHYNGFLDSLLLWCWQPS